MKVALVNNMNNNFFAFTRYLRELGVDAHLFIVDRLLDHFQPACDSFDEISSLSYIHEVAQLDPLDFYRYFFSRKLRRRLKHFRDELEQFDVVIACGNLTHLIRLGIKIDIFIPYGRDAYYFVDYPEASLRRRNYFKYLFAKRLDFLQNKSIKEARVMITLADYSKKVKEAFTRLGRSWINWSVPMVYLLKQQDSDKWLFLEKYDFIVFNHSRQIWKEKGDCECKGNDKLIRAFAKFIGLCSSKNPILILFEFGKDVESSKRLIEELNISDRVIWMPLLVRKFIMQGLKKAQIAFDQISTFAAAIGGVTMEAFACAIPIIGKKEFLEMNVVSHVPVLHANEAEDILDILLDCEKYPDKYKQLGKNGQDWFQNNVGIGLALKYKKLMEFMMLNPKLKLEDTDFQNFLLQEFKMKISNC